MAPRKSRDVGSNPTGAIDQKNLLEDISMGISISDVVNVKNIFCWEGETTYWKGEVTIIENGGRDR